jgi:hypothetical protein
MKGLVFVTLSMIAMTATAAPSALALDKPFEDARDQVINRLDKPFEDARDRVINRMTDRFEEAIDRNRNL